MNFELQRNLCFRIFFKLDNLVSDKIGNHVQNESYVYLQLNKPDTIAI